MQIAYHIKNDKEYAICLPDEDENLFGTIRWGRLEKFFTPAFWYVQTCFMSLQNNSPLQYRLGNSFEEEVIACLLGGYGIPSEIGNAKFRQFRQAGIFQNIRNVTYRDIEELMLLPITHQDKKKKYRFAKQKAGYVYDALNKVADIDEKRLGDKELRNALLDIKGIGPKTASWIVRNFRDSNKVAILDIHLKFLYHLAKINLFNKFILQNYSFKVMMKI